VFRNSTAIVQFQATMKGLELGFEIDEPL